MATLIGGGPVSSAVRCLSTLNEKDAKMYRTIVCCVAIGLAIFLALSSTLPSIIAAPAEQSSASVEYKVVPASEFGMNVRKGEGVFDYSDMADKLNKFAADGWQYRDFIKAADGSTVLSVVLLERRR